MMYRCESPYLCENVIDVGGVGTTDVKPGTPVAFLVDDFDLLDLLLLEAISPVLDEGTVAVTSLVVVGGTSECAEVDIFKRKISQEIPPFSFQWVLFFESVIAHLLLHLSVYKGCSCYLGIIL